MYRTTLPHGHAQPQCPPAVLTVRVHDVLECGGELAGGVVRGRRLVRDHGLEHRAHCSTGTTTHCIRLATRCRCKPRTLCNPSSPADCMPSPLPALPYPWRMREQPPHAAHPAPAPWRPQAPRPPPPAPAPDRVVGMIEQAMWQGRALEQWCGRRLAAFARPAQQQRGQQAQPALLYKQHTTVLSANSASQTSAAWRSQHGYKAVTARLQGRHSTATRPSQHAYTAVTAPTLRVTSMESLFRVW